MDDEADKIILYADGKPYITLEDIAATQRRSIELLEANRYSAMVMENAIKNLASAGMEIQDEPEIVVDAPKTDYLKVRMTIEKIPFWELVHLCGFWKAIGLYFERRKS